MPSECFPLTYGLNGRKSRVNRNFICGLFLISFIECFSLSLSFSCNFMPRNGFLALYGVNLH